MAALRDLLIELGHTDARTWIVSGNAWFTSRRGRSEGIGAEIEEAIERRFGFPGAVVVRSVDELAAVVDANPFPEATADPRRYYAIFLSREPTADRLSAIQVSSNGRDMFAVGDRVIYAWYRDGLQRSKLASQLTDAGLGVTATARNWNTVTKMLELARGEAPRPSGAGGR